MYFLWTFNSVNELMNFINSILIVIILLLKFIIELLWKCEKHKYTKYVPTGTKIHNVKLNYIKMRI